MANKIKSNIRVGAQGLNVSELRNYAENNPDEFSKTSQELIDEGLRWQDVKSVRALQDALSRVKVQAHVEGANGNVRAVMSSAFPLLSGGLTVAGVNDAYDAVPTVGQDLVTDMDDRKKDSTYAGITSEDLGVESVKEGDPYPQILAGEETYKISHLRNGRRLSITQEMIDENDIAGIVQRVNALGEIAAELIEELTLKRVTDLNGSTAAAAEPYVLHNPTGTTLYTTTANSPGTKAPSGTQVNNNTLAGVENLEAIRVVLAAMKNTRGKRIAIPMNRCTLLVPDALASVASVILGSEMVSGVENELSDWGPRGRHRPMLRTTPKLDDLSTTAYYLGWFDKQFIRKWKQRFQIVSLQEGTEAFLQRGIAFQARIGWDCEVGASDYVYVVRSLTGTTAPTP